MTPKRRWMRLAADQGFAPAQASLGLMYIKGQGVEKGAEQAAQWFRLAANQGIANAQSNLGLLYFKGQGVAQDDQEAVHSSSPPSRACPAQIRLGMMHEQGRGVPQDLVAACMWYSIGTAQGDATAIKERDRLSRKLTAQGIAPAE